MQRSETTMLQESCSRGHDNLYSCRSDGVNIIYISECKLDMEENKHIAMSARHPHLFVSQPSLSSLPS